MCTLSVFIICDDRLNKIAQLCSVCFISCYLWCESAVCSRKNQNKREDLQITRPVEKKIKSENRNSSWKQLKTSDFKISCSVLINTENCNADMNTRTAGRGELMTKKWSDANTRKGRRYATPNCRGFIYAPWDLSLLRREGSLYYFPLSLMIDQHRFFSLTLPHNLPTPPLKSPILSPIKICPSITTDLSQYLTLHKLTKIQFPELLSVKNNYSICSRANNGSLYFQYSFCVLQS